jgi:hypothetical protein
VIKWRKGSFNIIPTTKEERALVDTGYIKAYEFLATGSFKFQRFA